MVETATGAGRRPPGQPSGWNEPRSTSERSTPTMIDVTPEFILLALVVVTALAFDFTNGFHDTANAMATSIATKALTPKAAVSLSAILNLVGAFLSVEVAITVTNAVIRIQNPDGTPKAELLGDGGHGLLLILMAGLAGAIIWNILTWLWGLPSSSSHALFGGLVGATIAGVGWNGVKWIGDGSQLDGVIGKVVLPAPVSYTHLDVYKRQGFDEGHVPAQLTSHQGRLIPAGPATDDHHVRHARILAR